MSLAVYLEDVNLVETEDADCQAAAAAAARPVSFSVDQNFHSTSKYMYSKLAYKEAACQYLLLIC